VPEVCGRDVTMARRPNPAKIEPVVTSKCTSGRPLLIDSALQTEFRATHSKQTTEKFLTGARTHISVFNFSPFTTQNPAQLIQRHGRMRRKRIQSRYSIGDNSYLSHRFTRASLRADARSTADNRRRNPYQIPKTVLPENPTGITLFLIPKTVPPENSTGVSQFLSRRFTRASLRFHARPAPKPVPSAPLLPGSAQNIENDVTSSKQTTEDFLPGAPTTPSLSPDNASFTIKISVEPRGGPHDSNPRKEGTMRRAELSLRASGVAAVICMALAASQVPARAQRKEQPMEHRGEQSGEHSTAYRTIQIDGLNIFYREAGPKDAPTLLLLHGLPSSSRMFDPLFVRLADRYHMVAPDYPGFGHSDWPDPKKFAYTFDHIAEVMTHFTEALELSRYTLYMQDYGGPVGFRMILAHPERVEALIVQDAVAHNEGLGANWKTRREFWADRAANETALRTNLLSMAPTRARHVGDDPNVERHDPDLWTDEYYFLNQPGQGDIQSDLFYDYRTNVENYPKWDAWMREKQPRLLVIWGKYESSFDPSEPESYRRDVPKAEIHIVDGGHFALDTAADEIAFLVRQFMK
jgi:pimeloyl-ACP methyl ester carboxylesterase